MCNLLNKPAKHNQKYDNICSIKSTKYMADIMWFHLQHITNDSICTCVICLARRQYVLHIKGMQNAEVQLLYHLMTAWLFDVRMGLEAGSLVCQLRLQQNNICEALYVPVYKG